MNSTDPGLHQLDANLWELERPLKAPGLRMHHRMTVARLASGELWVHSPVAFNESIARSLVALGPVTHFIAPNIYHDLYWREWFAGYPKATFYCAPGVKEGHPDLPFHRVLSATERESWEADLPKLLIGGMPRLNEFVFLHAVSRTLIVADLVFNFDVSQQHLLGKLLLKLNGIYGRVGCSRIFRRLIKDRAAFGASIEELMRWDFDRIVLGHSRIVATDGRAVLARAFAWLNRDTGGDLRPHSGLLS
jgi:hypothetical protein